MTRRNLQPPEQRARGFLRTPFPEPEGVDNTFRVGPGSAGDLEGLDPPNLEGGETTGGETMGTAAQGGKWEADKPRAALWEETASGRGRWGGRGGSGQGPAHSAFPPPVPGTRPGPEQVLGGQLPS